MSAVKDAAERGGLPRPALQVFAVVGGMGVWGVAILTAYPLVQVACAAGLPILVHLVRWIAMVIALAATFAGFRTYRLAGSADPTVLAPPRIERARFVGLGAMLISASGVLLLVVEDMATWVIDPCL